MGKRGPKPATTDLKVLSGTFRADRDNETPRAAPIMPEIPDWLPAEAKEKFEKEAPALVSLGILTAIDGDQFGLYCLYMTRAAEAEKEIEKYGLLIASAREDGARVKNPACQLARDYGAAACRLADKFGLNAVSRNNVSVHHEPAEIDPMEQLLSSDMFLSRGEPGHQGEDCSKYWR